jgi:predicted RNase H-like HicB family nuclease
MDTLEYAFVVQKRMDKDGSIYWEAAVPDLRGCVASADQLCLLLAELESTRAEWLDTAGLLKMPVPSPTALHTLLVRMRSSDALEGRSRGASAMVLREDNPR